MMMSARYTEATPTPNRDGSDRRQEGRLVPVRDARIKRLEVIAQDRFTFPAREGEGDGRRKCVN
jgi:hypothetical protein